MTRLTQSVSLARPPPSLSHSSLQSPHGPEAYESHEGNEGNEGRTRALVAQALARRRSSSTPSTTSATWTRLRRRTTQFVQARGGDGADGGNDELAAYSMVATRKLGDWLQVVKPLAFHWALRDHVDAAFKRDVQEPRKGFTYLLWDHKETPSPYS